MKNNTIQKNISGSLKIKKSVNLCIHCGKVFKKIFKISFSKKTSDFFVLLPYFNSKEFHVGMMTIPKGQNELGNFNAVQKGNGSRVPVKFSYHRDGNVHFKPINQPVAVNVGYKLAHIKTNALNQLNGEHLFTVQFENISRFEDLTAKEKSDICIVGIDEESKFVKILAFAGNSREQVSGIYKDRDALIIEMSRADMDKKVFIGLYVLPYKEKTSKDNDENGYILALVGFPNKKVPVSEELKTLYIYAK